MPNRAAIYARYSTDLQRERSIADQVALCEGYAAREGLTIAATFTDHACTSASILGRTGLLDMMAAARDHAFDMIIVEELDRLSRDMADLANLHKRLEFWGIELRSVHGGTADDVTVGLRGIMGQMWMRDHRHKVRRGMAGVVRDGRHAGGRAYGYRPKTGEPGALEIVEAEAEVIRRIFRDYAAGQSPRAIAGALNRQRITAPRGARWNASTINGQASRGAGILRNDLYRGLIIWNKSAMIRNPETGKRVSRANAPDARQQVTAEHLRIVPADLWARTRAALDARTTGKRGGHNRRPMRPFSGLLKCGECGGGVVISKRRGPAIWCRCATRAEAGTCTNRREMRLDRIEAAIFDSLADQLHHPAYLEAYVAEYHAERRRLNSAARKDRATLERNATKAAAAFDRAHKLYTEGVTDGPEAATHIRTLLDTKREAEAALATADAPDTVIEIHPTALRRYTNALKDLASALADDREMKESTDLIRKLVATITVTPALDGTLDLTIDGHMSALLHPDPMACRGQLVAEDRYRRSPRQKGRSFLLAL